MRRATIGESVFCAIYPKGPVRELPGWGRLSELGLSVASHRAGDLHREVQLFVGDAVCQLARVDDVTESDGGDYAREVLDNGGPSLPNPYALAPGETPQAEAFVTERVNKARETNPDIPVFDPEAIRAEIGRDRAAVRARRGEVARRETGFAAGAGAFLGTAGAIMMPSVSTPMSHQHADQSAAVGGFGWPHGLVWG